MEYYCVKCNKEYASYQSLWIHNKKFHPINNKSIDKSDKLHDKSIDKPKHKNYKCNKCNKNFIHYQSRWKHEKKCKINKDDKNNETKEINNKINILTEKIKILENKPTTVKNIQNINNGMINKGAVYNFLSKPGDENIHLLTEKEIEYIMDKELNCIVGLVEVLNFNEKYPENHTFCTTALNDKYISTMNSDTLIIEKQRKKDFFDKILVDGINKMKILYEKLKSKKTSKAIEYKNNIDKLIEFVIVNNKGKKAYVELMNTLTFNKRHITQSTWFQLTNNIIPNEPKLINIEKEEKVIELYENFNDIFIINSESKDESESDSDSITNEINEIKIKNISYIVNNMMIYIKNDDGTQGTLYGKYINGKIKKVKL
jgi:hypothetical protein